MDSNGSNHGDSAINPESLLGSQQNTEDAQAAGRQEFVEGMLEQMLLENLKKAGQPSEDSREGW